MSFLLQLFILISLKSQLNVAQTRTPSNLQDTSSSNSSTYSPSSTASTLWSTTQAEPKGNSTSGFITNSTPGAFVTSSSGAIANSSHAVNTGSSGSNSTSKVNYENTTTAISTTTPRGSTATPAISTTRRTSSGKFLIPSRRNPSDEIKIIPSKRLRDCSEVLINGYRSSGTYKIFPFGDSTSIGNRSVYVYCDMTDGTGWTVIQSRGIRGIQRQSFDQNYSSYVQGFGSTCGDHWIGLETINALTAGNDQEIYISINGVFRPAYSNPRSYNSGSNYRFFKVGSKIEGFPLYSAEYRGAERDFLAGLNGTKFYTKDTYNKTCSNSSATYAGPWWYAISPGYNTSTRRCLAGSNTFNDETFKNTGFGKTPAIPTVDYCSVYANCFSYLPQSEMRIRNPFAKYRTTLTEARALMLQYQSVPRDCTEIQLSGNTLSGVYTIYPWGTKDNPLFVFCDLVTLGGGWTVFLKRGESLESQREEFSLTWGDYEKGFGQTCGDVWMGLSSASALTTSISYEARIELTDWTNVQATANYGIFEIGSSSERYRLTLQNYSGNAGDALGSHNGALFSTQDMDNDSWDDGSCAQSYMGGWWYVDCLQANLNGEYLSLNQSNSDGRGIVWSTWKGANYTLKSVAVKLRKTDFTRLKNVISLL